MYILDISKLETGDIILTTQKHIISKTIRVATSSDISHAILYVGDSSYIHADGEGVQSGNPQRLLFKKESYVKVLRAIKNIDRLLVDNVCLYARNEIGKQYSLKDAINTKNPLSKKKVSNRQFCSRLVAQSYESVGISLVQDSRYCSPQELDDSELTEIIPNCLKLASPKEIEFAQSESPLQKQVEITNEIFENIRKLTGADIQTFEQLTNYIIINKKHDIEITKIIEDSGYLFMWQSELDSNPWRYDKDVFFNMPISNEQMREVATKELGMAKEILVRQEMTYNQFMQLWQVHQLKYAMIHITLYQKLLELTGLIIATSEHILENTKQSLAVNARVTEVKR